MLALDSIGNFKVVGVLGEGSMGIVYKAFDPAHGQALAIKMVHERLLSSDQGDLVRKRLKKEAELGQRLLHRNIVRLLGHGEFNQVPFIVLEYVRGKTLEGYLQEKRFFEIYRIIDIALQILEGLAYAHQRGVIHRDIKPANIILLESGLVKIADFGVAKLRGSSSTTKGKMMGTPGYMPPEQIMDQAVDARSDLFSLAVILYELLSGINPYLDESQTRTIFRIVNFDPPMPSRLNTNVLPELDQIVQKALAKDPNERFQSAEEFSQALQSLASHM